MNEIDELKQRCEELELKLQKEISEKNDVTNALQDKLKTRELDIQYQLSEIENLKKRCEQLEKLLGNMGS